MCMCSNQFFQRKYIICILFLSQIVACKSNNASNQNDDAHLTAEDVSPSDGRDLFKQDCDGLKEEECKPENGCASIYGSKFNSDLQCFESHSYAGCWYSGYSCTATVSNQLDFNGNCWFFGNGGGDGCTPHGWTSTVCVVKPETACP